MPLAIAVRQDVDVSAPFIPIDRDSAALGTLIDQRQVAGLPLDGRNFLELALLAPGTTPAPQGSASSVRGDFAFSVNGGREDANAYLLDGVYNMDPKLGTPGVRPPVDGIHEFAVETSTYDASFGRNAAGQINVVTRAGANRFAGTAYEFFRNGALDERNAFAPRDEPAPDYNRNQFGGSLGGPIAADRHILLRRLRAARGFAKGIDPRDQRADRWPSGREIFRSRCSPGRSTRFRGSPSRRPHPRRSRSARSASAIAALYPLPNRSTPFANYVASPDRNRRRATSSTCASITRLPAPRG